VGGGQAAAGSQGITAQQACMAHATGCLEMVRCWWRWVYYNFNLLLLTVM